jgi:hypothetical protein
MIRNLYLVLVVATRSAALYVILSSVFAWGVALIMSGGSGFGLPLFAMLLPIVAGLLLWFLAKPLAVLLTRDLE